MSASLAVQKRVRAALAAVPGVTGVFDGPPPDQPAPYLVIGPDVVADWSSKSTTGHEHRVSISVWDAGPGMARAKRIAGDVEAVLRGLDGEADGHRIVSSQFVRSLALSDADAWTQAIVDFRVRTVELRLSP